MAVGSGLAGQLSIKAETTFGTYAAPDRHIVGWLKGNPTLKPNRVQGGGLYAGEVGERADRYVETHREASGTIEVEISRKQAGLIFNQLLGGTASVVQQGATSAWLQTHTAQADVAGKSLTIMVGVPQADGTVRAYTFLGSKITKATFSCGVGELLTCSVEVDCRDLTEAQTLVAASYPTGAEPFSFKELTVKTGTFASEASVTGIKKVTIEIERPVNTERQYAGAGGLKADQTTNGPMKVSGTLETDFVDKTKFVDLFIANSSTSLVVEWVGPIIASTFANTVRFKLPHTFFTDGTPEVDGPDVVSVNIPFESKLGANGFCTVEYMSTDTAI